VGLIAAVGMAAFMTGCGDDNNNDTTTGGTNGGTTGQPQFAPADQATAQALTYSVTTTNGTSTLTFPNATSYTYAPAGGTPENGTVANVHREGEDWVATATPADNNGTIKAGEMRLHFTGKDATSYSGTFTGVGADNTPITGTFVAAAANNGTTDGGTTGTTTGGHPGSLSGHTLQLANNGGGQELFSLSGNNFTSDIGGSGTYTYTLNGDSALFNPSYTDAGHNGDFYSLTLTFTSANAGTFVGNQHFEGADHETSGNFSISP